MTETTAFRAKMGAIFLFGLVAMVALFAGIARAEPYNGVYAGADIGYETAGQVNASGLEYGGFIGYNFRAAPALVIGIEGRIGGSTVAETITTTTPTAITTVNNDIGLSIGGTARIGWLPGKSTMLFVRGGYETVELNSLWTRTQRPPTANPNPVTQDFGFWQGSATIGGGVEQLVWDKLSVRLTYDWAEASNVHQLRAGVAWNF
jgi:opacity protein-like surface antigen